MYYTKMDFDEVMIQFRIPYYSYIIYLMTSGDQYGEAMLTEISIMFLFLTSIAKFLRNRPILLLISLARGHEMQITSTISCPEM